MLLGKRLFPYPILNSEKVLSEYADSDFRSDYDPVQEDEDYVFKGARYILTNDYLQGLIAEGKAKCVLFVECSATRFRNVFELSSEPRDIRIPMSKLNDKISVSAYIYATQDISPFKPTGLNYDYYDEVDEFFVEANCVLAIDEFDRIKINYNVDDDNLTSSIFTIVGDPEIKDGSIHTEVTKRKIRVTIPRDAYGSYVGVKDYDDTKWLPFAIMLVPSLIEAFERIKSGGDRKPLDDVEFEYDWFASVRARYRKIYMRPMNEEDFYGSSSYLLAQQLLDMPSSKAVNVSFELISKGVKD